MSDAEAAGGDGGKELQSRDEDTHETNASGQKVTAAKDKHCRYCNQLFTSSSLGRHLDQYLFKKKPDGIHDVEEIRRLRSGITRRTARGSNKQASPDTTGNTSTPDPHTIPPLQLNPKGAGKGFRVFLNQPTWQATGVINDIPNSSQVSQLKIPATPLERFNQLSDSNPETARALELALREVLDSVKAATRFKSSKVSPFDFELQSQTFPALCLQALPPPPSLFSTHPFSSLNFFPIEPPTPNQRDIVQQALRAQIQQWKSEKLSSISTSEQDTPTYQAVSPNSEVELIERSSKQHEDIMVHHLDLSLRHWMTLPVHEQNNIWRLEIARAFAREKERRRKVEEQLERTQQEANQLRAQVEKLTSCQWPREFAIFPPNLLPLTPDVARELDDKDSKMNGPESSRWEYDNIVAKWKRVVMHDKSMGRSGVGAFMDPIVVRQQAATVTQNLLRKIPNSSNRSSVSSNRLQMPSPSHQSNPVSPESMNQDRPTATSAESGEPNDVNDRPVKRQRTGTHQPSTPYGEHLPAYTSPVSSNPTIQNISGLSNRPTAALAHSSYNAQSTLPLPIGRDNAFFRGQNLPSASPHAPQRPPLDNRSVAEREVSNAMVSMHQDSVPHHAPLPPPPLPPQHHPYSNDMGRQIPMNLNAYSRHPGAS